MAVDHGTGGSASVGSNGSGSAPAGGSGAAARADDSGSAPDQAGHPNGHRRRSMLPWGAQSRPAVPHPRKPPDDASD